MKAPAFKTLSLKLSLGLTALSLCLSTTSVAESVITDRPIDTSVLIQQGQGQEVQGGFDSGGGNLTLISYPSYTSGIQNDLDYIRRILPQIFNGMHLYTYGGLETFDALNQRLSQFSSPQARNEFFRQIRFEYRSGTEKCLSAFGVEQDASVHGMPANTVCFQLDRLSEKLNTSSQFQALAGLVFHEVAHLLGIMDEEKVTSTQTTITLTMPDRNTLSNYFRNMQQHAQDINYMIESIDNVLQTSQPTVIACITLGSITPQDISSRIWNAGSYGHMAISKRGMELLTANSLRAISAMMSCLRPEEPDYQALLEELEVNETSGFDFHPGSEFDSSRLAEDMQYYRFTEIEPVRFQVPLPGQWKEAHALLRDVRRDLLEVQSELSRLIAD